MEALRQKPVFALDHEARKQIRETRATILEHLRGEPDDFKALVLADAVGEIDPDRDATLAAHRLRFRATRPADWKVRARELGLDRLLFHLVQGMLQARIGAGAVPALERYATAISEARADLGAAGHIDASSVPAGLRVEGGGFTPPPGVDATYHPSGHLARVKVYLDELHHGELVLGEQPGSGRYTIVEKRGGSGTMIREDYRDGGVVTTLNTPWHDGCESIDKKSWTRWVEDNLADLARLAAIKPARRARRRRAGRRARA